LHEPYRAPLAPLLSAVRERVAGDHAVLGATLSGAGPSVLVWCLLGSEQGVAASLAGQLSGASVRVVAVAKQGVSID
jgi:homoserine kinase